MKIVPSDNNGTVHLSTVAGTSEYSASDWHRSSKWHFLSIYVPDQDNAIRDISDESMRILTGLRCNLLHINEYIMCFSGIQFLVWFSMRWLTSNVRLDKASLHAYLALS
jgi:hypothetical protein